MGQISDPRLLIGGGHFDNQMEVAVCPPRTKAHDFAKRGASTASLKVALVPYRAAAPGRQGPSPSPRLPGAHHCVSGALGTRGLPAAQEQVPGPCVGVETPQLPDTVPDRLPC